MPDCNRKPEINSDGDARLNYGDDPDFFALILELNVARAFELKPGVQVFDLRGPEVEVAVRPAAVGAPAGVPAHAAEPV